MNNNYVVFENIPILNIIDEINVKYTREYNTSPYIGEIGSSTNFVSELGKIISFKSILPKYSESDYSIEDYRNLSVEYKNKTGVLTSTSNLDLKGNYLCTNFEVTEDTGNNFTISWEFTEVMGFNRIKKSFRVWGSAKTATQPSTKKPSSTTTKKSGSTNSISTNTKKLLKDCGTLSPSNKSRTCVKYLQKFLQAGGFYTKYKIDGIYAKYTTAELKKAQKKRKLKQTGKWDKATIRYYQKKYKYP